MWGSFLSCCLASESGNGLVRAEVACAPCLLVGLLQETHIGSLQATGSMQTLLLCHCSGCRQQHSILQALELRSTLVPLWQAACLHHLCLTMHACMQGSQK